MYGQQVFQVFLSKLQVFLFSENPGASKEVRSFGIQFYGAQRCTAACLVLRESNSEVRILAYFLTCSGILKGPSGSKNGLLTFLLALESSRVPSAYLLSQAYHAKYQQSYGASEPMDVLPSNCSGLCMAACLALAFVVLQWLQPTPPDKPIVVKGTFNRARNNSCGWVIPYGGLQYLTPEQVEELANTRTATGSDGLADHVSSAESSAAFLKGARDHMKAAGE